MLVRYRTIVSDEAAKGFHGFAQYGIAWSLMQQEKYAEARKELEPLLADGRTDSISQEALLAEGVCLRKTGKAKEAIEVLDKFLIGKPTELRRQCVVRVRYVFRRNEATRTGSGMIERVVSEVPDYPASDKLLYELGWIAEEKADKPLATKYFGQLVEKYPASNLVAESLYHIAQFEYDSEKYGEAVTAYTKVLSKATNPSLQEKALYKLGGSHFQQENYVKAAEQFRKQSTDFPQRSIDRRCKLHGG